MPGTKRSRSRSRSRSSSSSGRSRSTSWGRRQRSNWASGHRARYNYRNAMTTVPRNKLAFAQSARTTLRLTEVLAWELPATGALDTVSIKANGLFEPTVGGRQPRGFDEYMNIYETYTVLGAKLSVNFAMQAYDAPVVLNTAGQPPADTDELVNNHPSGTGTTVVPACPPITCMIQKSVGDISGATYPADLIEQGKTTWTTLIPTGEQKVLRSRMNVSEFFGKANLVGSSGYTGSAAANPTELLQFHVSCARMNAIQDSLGEAQVRCKGMAVIEYDVVFTEPKKLGAS